MVARTRAPDYAAAGILVMLAAVIVWESTRWPAAAAFAGNPTLVPHSLAVLMVVTAIAIVWFAGAGMPAERGHAAGALLAIGATAALAALLPVLGVIGAGIPYLLALQRACGAPGRISAISAVVTPIALYAVFAKGLNVPLPVGSLWTMMAG
jgi:hypothetical protein